jgi:hypothetical protein
MLVAVLVAHFPVLWKKLDDEKRYRNTLAAVIFALLLVFLGVALLPGNRWAELF